jgi:hypothetical protein
MLNPEYVDDVENDPNSVKVGFTDDGQQALEIQLRKRDAHELGMMLIKKTHWRKK